MMCEQRVSVNVRARTYVERDLDSPDFSCHQGLREVDLGVPQLGEEREAQLACSVLLQDFLENGSQDKSTI